ncbi:MAG TPA: NAD(P)-binding domain-containing protein [Nitrososphaerales archaeon]|nr:NAD(P)-binding domain-containing protein [Nitrososphaerales archaeon]
MMRVGILGGTGAMGSGLAEQLSKKHEVRMGSRDAARARAAATRIAGVVGDGNEAVALWCETAIVAVPFSAVESLRELAKALSGKLVISIINPLRKEGAVLQYASGGLSAAELVAQALPRSSVATAFNNVPAAFVRNPPKEGLDILVAASTKDAYERTAGLVRSIQGMRPLYVGPLSQAESVERLTVMVLNAAMLNGVAKFSTKFVSR